MSLNTLFIIFILILCYLPHNILSSESSLTHQFLLVPTKDDSFSLDFQEYVFILIPRPTSEERYHVSVRGIFPVPSYFEIDNLSPYLFKPEEFCTDCLILNHIQVLKGNIFKGITSSLTSSLNRSSEKFLSNVYLNLNAIDYGKPLELEYNPMVYILLTPISKSEKSKRVILMKKESKDLSHFFQVIKATMIIKTPGEFEFAIGEEINIKNGDNPIKTGGEYSSIIAKDQIIMVQYDEIVSLICTSNNIEYKNKCNDI